MKRSIVSVSLVFVVLEWCQLVGEARADYFTFSTTASVTDLSGSGMTVTGNGTNFVTIAANANDHVELAGLSDSSVAHVTDTGHTFRFGTIQTFNIAHKPRNDYDFTVTYSTTINDYAHAGGGAGADLLASQTLINTVEYAGKAATGGDFSLSVVTSSLFSGPLTFPGDPLNYQVDPGSIPDPANKTLKKLSLDIRSVPEPPSLALIAFGGLASLYRFRRRFTLAWPTI